MDRSLFQARDTREGRDHKRQVLLLSAAPPPPLLLRARQAWIDGIMGRVELVPGCQPFLGPGVMMTSEMSPSLEAAGMGADQGQWPSWVVRW